MHVVKLCKSTSVASQWHIPTPYAPEGFPTDKHQYQAPWIFTAWTSGSTLAYSTGMLVLALAHCCEDARTSPAMSYWEYKSYRTANRTCLWKCWSDACDMQNSEVQQESFLEPVDWEGKISHPVLCLAVLLSIDSEPSQLWRCPQFSSLRLACLRAQLAFSSCSSLLKTSLLHSYRQIMLLITAIFEVPQCKTPL